MRTTSMAAAVAMLAAACAHTPDLGLRAEAPAPAGEEVGSWQARDGTMLWQRHWLPTATERGVLVIMHGLADHSDLYDRFARRAAAAGYSVWAFDMRGHARSAGPRVNPSSFEDYVDDLDQFIARVHTAEPSQPVFLMGHSMGGAIAALTTVERKPPIAGLILSSAALNLGAPLLALDGATLAGALTPGVPGLDLDPVDFSQDPAVVATMKADPWIWHESGPVHLVSEFSAGTSRIWTNVDRLTMPLLVLHGTADRLTAPSGSRAIVDAAPSTDKTLRIYDGAWHVLLAEPIHAQVEDDLLAWLGAHTGGPAVTAPPIDHARALHGDPKQSVQSIAIGGGIVHDNGTTEGLGELAIRLTKLAPIGWAGAGSVRYDRSGGWDAALLPLGLAVRPGTLVLGLAGGIGTAGPGANLTVPAAAWLEIPLGPIHATASAQLDYVLRGSPLRAALLSSDRAWIGLALRLPGDRQYWPGASAGVGPYVSAGVASFEGANALQVTAGLALYGAD